jgi:hypothetical protein
MKPEGSLPCSQNPTTGPYSERIASYAEKNSYHLVTYLTTTTTTTIIIIIIIFQGLAVMAQSV